MNAMTPPQASEAAVKLTDRQLEVLRDLRRMHNRPGVNSHNMTGTNWNGEPWPEEVRGYWASPMDFGGSNGSHHSATATQLAKKGLVERYKNGRINFFKSRNKGACMYRISAAGIALIDSLQAPTP